MKNKHKFKQIARCFYEFYINKHNNFVSILNKQVKLLNLSGVIKYDEELFTFLFDLTNKILIRKFFIKFFVLISDKDRKNMYEKIHEKILSLKVQNEVSIYIKVFKLKH